MVQEKSTAPMRKVTRAQLNNEASEPLWSPPTAHSYRQQLPKYALRHQGVSVQPKLQIGAVNDALEQEADHIADKVLHGAHNTAAPKIQPSKGQQIQRKCASCEAEEEKIQRKPLAVSSHSPNQGLQAGPAISQKILQKRGTGGGLQKGTLKQMNQSFGHDFSNVRIHTDTEAAQLNRQLQAKAFTIGSDIFFGQGQFQPESPTGQHLLAHELVHTLQQANSPNQGIQRVCDTTAYDARVAEIRALPLYSSIPAHPDAIYQPADAQTHADTILTEARTRDNCMYYADAMHTLFSTPESPPSTISAAFGPIMAQAAADEATRLGTTYGAANANFEETLSADPSRVFQDLVGEGGKTYQIDSRDPANVVIKIKVNPSGDPTAVSQLLATEDAIEKKASVLGYTVDLEFVNTSGSDVFRVGVDPGAWPTSGNWVRGPQTTAHELHHLMRLPDRYNYINSHSGNARMYIANRIHWFMEEFRRSPSPLVGISFMGGGGLVTDQDICEAMQAPNMTTCLASRRTLRQPGIAARDITRDKVARAIAIMEGINTDPAEQASVDAAGQAAIGTSYDRATVAANLRLIKTNIQTAEIQMENSSATECDGRNLSFMTRPLAFILCTNFSTLSAEQKANEFVKTASEMGPSTFISPTEATGYGAFIESIFSAITF